MGRDGGKRGSSEGKHEEDGAVEMHGCECVRLLWIGVKGEGRSSLHTVAPEVIVR